MLFAMQPSYNELCHAIGVRSLSVPPSIFERALHLVNQRFHNSGAKTDVLRSLIDYHASPETQWLNVAGS